ncbi:MAG: outer membrane protein assembly factor BamD [Deltaproteobacteria bacterium]|nr:outer membrane protein assembly factor BamD [Deltaproteobacteria bacterium]MBW1914211.1 outer membrane protein assembly factor BamD [Deltaproteobacteria bacterium]
MHTIFNTIKQISAISLMIMCLGACSSHYDPWKGKNAEEIMNKGILNMEWGSHESATEAFQNVKDRYPYSKFAILAELKMADSLFIRSEFEDAYIAYDEYERMHPKDKNIPYVIYRKGMCHFKQIKTVDREQSNALKAKDEFERLINRFPEDIYAAKARKNIRECLISLAEAEISIGHFYYKMKKYTAAMNRYLYAIKNYPDMGQYNEALEYISRCRENLTDKMEGSNLINPDTES